MIAGKNDARKSLDEFKIPLDQTTDYGVCCPLVSKKLMPPFLVCY